MTPKDENGRSDMMGKLYGVYYYVIVSSFNCEF